MKLLKFIGEAIGSIANFLGAIIGVGFLLALLTGFVTIGCSKSFWTEKTACTFTAIFNTPK